MTVKYRDIKPQLGFQEKFLSCPADIIIGGGAAGTGKTFALLVDYLKDTKTPNWYGAIFRRNAVQISNVGGLWDTSESIYGGLHKSIRPRPKQQPYFEWRFKNRSRLTFRHLQHEKDKLAWQGSQIGYLGFDELTHFSASQFFYLLSRNRSTCGVRPRTRATTNPQGEGWVKDLVKWWLYPDNYPDETLSGFPILARAGVARFFRRHRNKFVFGNTPEEVLSKIPASDLGGLSEEELVETVKSITFIPGRLEENIALMKADPGYRGNLLAQDEQTKQQLYDGRWKIIADDYLKFFKYEDLVESFHTSYVPRGTKYITADIAFEGSDLFVICVWEGWRLIDVITIPKSHGKDVLRQIEKAARSHQVLRRNIAYDAVGSGGFLKGFLRASYAFNSSSSPIDHKEWKKDRYFNLRAQCVSYLAEKITNAQVYFSVGDGDNEPMLDRITTELYAHEKTEDSIDKKIQVISKRIIRDRLGHSPDLADAIIMRAVFDLLPRGGRRSHSA